MPRTKLYSIRQLFLDSSLIPAESSLGQAMVNIILERRPKIELHTQSNSIESQLCPALLNGLSDYFAMKSEENVVAVEAA